ncbi:hypothetical protein D6833_05820 [Candidatus Parcubacteria bacterium]|nr:MAG: hypothetical protein D6833_05820 [Candidatus Parcubacteria bacterium]
MKKQITLIWVLVFIFTTNSAQAFDGKRKGFILGSALGLGYMSSNTFKHLMLPFEINVGHAPSNTTEIYFTMKVDSWFGEPGFGTLAMYGVGGNYYGLSEKWFLTSAVGWTVVTGASESEGQALIGWAYSVGVGYQFGKHWHVKAEALSSDMIGIATSSSGGTENFVKSLNLRVTLSVMAF